MDFSIPPSLQETLASVRKFLADEVYPHRADSAARPFRELLPTLAAKRDRVREMGLFAPQVPKENGGGGLGFMEHALLSEELGRTPAGPLRFQLPGARRRQYGNPATSSARRSRKRRGWPRWSPARSAAAFR